jgi:lysophospholipase L1-like esterase
VVWGDSYTNRGYETTHIDRCNYAYHLQQMLGSGWKIYNGGCSGDVTNTIAARQGGIDMHIGTNDFTIPADCTPVDVGGVYSNRNFFYTEDTYTQIARYGLINPCEIVVEDAEGNEIARIEGNITHKGTTTNKTADFTSEVKFTRTTPGEAITVPAKSRLVTFAAKNLRNPDLTIIYMGQNGGYKSLDILYQQYRAMIDYAFPEGPENYIALGFHNHTKLAEQNVNNAYWDFFEGPNGFGVNESEGRPVSRFVNLFKELTGDNYAEYLALSGAAASPSDVSAADKEYVSQGMLPRSYWFDPEAGDIHPNEYGAKAFAHAVYKKIVELGYLD